MNAREAIEKMLQEKKISSKINYDVLKNLNQVEKKVPATSLLGSGVITAEPVELSNLSLSRSHSTKPISTPKSLQSRYSNHLDSGATL